MTKNLRSALLIILDGWGHSESPDHNAIHHAHTPTWDRLWGEYPHTTICTSGAAVGLPAGQMGNSEVGHLNLGAGRVVYQDFTRVTLSVRRGDFYTNRVLTDAVDKAKAAGGAVHILGLLSPGGVHSHEEHIHAMARLAVQRGVERVFVHAFLDGRDMPPKSAAPSLEAMQNVFTEAGAGRIASITGRYYAMDRDKHWERVQLAYDLLTLGEAEYVEDDPMVALEQAYARGENDEFVRPTRIGAPAPIQDGDAVVFMNYRSDRARQLTRTFIEEGFDGFERRAVPKLSEFVSLTEYHKDFDIPTAFPPDRLKNGFGEYIAQLGLHQLRLAETEKYAHVTFFFNGGVETPCEGEDRILVPSPRVATYDLQPEMSAAQVTDHLVGNLESGAYDAIIVNYANSDMVGHSGDFDAAVKAVEEVDRCLTRILDAVLRNGWEMLITADHGNAELMLDEANHQPHTAHTVNPAPLVYVGRPATLKRDGALCDVAPTMLSIMGLEQPREMTGHSLVELLDA